MLNKEDRNAKRVRRHIRVRKIFLALLNVQDFAYIKVTLASMLKL